MKRFLLQILVFIASQAIVPDIFALYADVTVAADGSGNYRTITEAMNALPMYNYQRYVIYVRNGVYNEKVLIDRDYITLVGESKDSTIIQFSQLRSDWQSNPDYIGPAVVNITSDDVILDNLTIRNTQPQIGPHAFAVYGTGTRTIIHNCRVISNGGDTVSLWNYKYGMYYHAGCYFEGGVDFVCPRGWCFIRDSEFFENSQTAAIWHAAVTNRDQKMVLVNCSFDGVQGYYLARHHYEAQFFFLNCRFSQTMDDKPIVHYVYPDEPEKNRPYFFGDRYYFYNCHRTGGDYAWHRDNPESWPAGAKPSGLTPEWTFDNQWDPESEKAPVITRYEIKSNVILFFFNELLCVRGNLILKTTTGKELKYTEGSGRNILAFECNSVLENRDLGKPLIRVSGSVTGNTATVYERSVSVFHLAQ